MHGIVHLVLDGLEEQPGRLGILVVIERRSIQVCHFLVKLALRQANLPDLLQLPFAESISGFYESSNPLDNKIGTRFSASADFVTL